MECSLVSVFPNSLSVLSPSALEYLPPTRVGATYFGEDAENAETRLCGPVHHRAPDGLQGVHAAHIWQLTYLPALRVWTLPFHMHMVVVFHLDTFPSYTEEGTGEIEGRIELKGWQARPNHTPQWPYIIQYSYMIPSHTFVKKYTLLFQAN